jgi:hypothetical protein
LVGWIRIQAGKNDPQKVKSKEFFFRMFSFRGQRFLLQLGHSSWRPRGKCSAIFFYIKNYNFKKLFTLYGHEIPGPGSGYLNSADPQQ